MKKIIYIAGLGHSGSTILDMVLGSHPNIIGLGEIYAVLNHKDHQKLYHNSTCSCGKKAIECSFWKDAKTILSEESSTNEKYLKVIDLFSQKFGENMILIDSSKNTYPYLNFLKERFDLKVLFLARDYRSWIYSRFSRVKTPLICLGIRWFLENKKLLYVLKKHQLEYLKLGYEEFAFFPEHILKIISEYIDLPYSDLMTVPGKTKSHIINGNIARIDEIKKERIYYDPKWLVSGRLNFVSGFLFFLQKFNNKFVYSNIMKGKVHAFGKKRFDFHIFGNKRKEELDKAHN